MAEDIVLNTNCKNRIKPKLIRDVKTEALLVFARTALERFFAKNENVELMKIGSIEDTKKIYKSLWDLKEKLEDVVVNVEYLLNLVQTAKRYAPLKKLAKYEEPLITYYDAMAKRIEFHIPKERVFMPEFLVLCTLSHWVIEEEKSVTLYPFLKDFDFLSLIEKYEVAALDKNEDKKNIVDIHRVSTDLIEILKKTKYKFNKDRVSKTRRKK
ncbi:hypothetical protein [Poseidonibacter lekithochrous]|uniref:hypothetical protein n=1 Tax=Poseidonibacter lekithochrous TaxID=1904463 RepID=UPI0008FC9DE1|nr:hypothetical protein [Poseidonibacter lekithochrous]QKJ22511.1 hypothetical protein ALEK_1232 [Poseidonibacter lekithochrous]